MRNVNVFTVVAMKFAELIGLVALTSIMTVQVINFLTLQGEFHGISKSVCAADAVSTKASISCFGGSNILLIVGLVLAWFHILHNNLLTNLRVMLAKSSAMLEMCCFKPINCLICKFGLGDEMNGC